MVDPDWRLLSDQPPHALTKVSGDPLLDELFPHVPHGIQWGLGRMEAFLRDTGDPHLGIPGVHV